MLTEVTKVWRKTNFRNLTSLKKLPRIEGSDHEGSLYHPAAKIDIGIQVDFASDLQAPEAQDNSEYLQYLNLIIMSRLKPSQFPVMHAPGPP